MINFFSSRSEAYAILEHYENYLLRCEYIIFIAVVEKTINTKQGFSILLGISKDAKGIVDFDPNLYEYDIITGQFGDNTIPTYFPSIDQLGKISKTNYSIKRNLKALSINQEYITYDIKWLDLIDTDLEPNIEIKTCRDKLSFQVKNEKAEGIKTTLGGLFRLEGFTNDLFGITNHHLFDNHDAALGDIVLDDDDEEIGCLFWKADDFEKDAAILKMNCFFINKYLVSKAILPLEIDRPVLGEIVHHNGVVTGLESKTLGAKIVSLNATVRIHKESDPEKWEIYKHQLLIEDYSESGDSGGLTMSADNKVVGLNFARTSAKKIIERRKSKVDTIYSVANNINKIFNYDFHYDQEVFHKKSVKDKNIIVTRLVKKFKLSNKI